MAIPINYNPAIGPAASTGTSDNYQASINAKLGQLKAPITADSAVVKAQTDPYRVASQRTLGANRDALAQASYAGGNMDTGGYQQMQQRARETAGQNEATNTGQVMATAEGQRAASEQGYMGMGVSGAAQQQGITNQAGQFKDQIGLNYGQLGQSENDFQATQGLSREQMAQQASQFGVTSAQQQQSINNQLAVAKMQNDLGYYNTDTGASVTSRGQDITAAGQL